MLDFVSPMVCKEVIVFKLKDREVWFTMRLGECKLEEISSNFSTLEVS